VRCLAKEPVLQYKSSRWVNSGEETISACLVYDPVQVEVLIENPMRKQMVTSLVKVMVYKDNAYLPDERVKEESRIVTLPLLSTGTLSIRFTPEQESGYHYTIFIEGKGVYNQPKGFPPRLHASKRESVLMLDEPSNGVSAGLAVAFTGRLVSADTGEGIAKAKIYIYDVRHMRKDNLMTSETTGDDGAFIIERTARGMHWWDHNVEIYAKFEGDDVYKPATSNQYSISLAQITAVNVTPIPQNVGNRVKL